jgi:hypothetical protein
LRWFCPFHSAWSRDDGRRVQRMEITGMAGIMSRKEDLSEWATYAAFGSNTLVITSVT